MLLGTPCADDLGAARALGGEPVGVAFSTQGFIPEQGVQDNLPALHEAIISTLGGQLALYTKECFESVVVHVVGGVHGVVQREWVFHVFSLVVFFTSFKGLMWT
jgi:hypothetical protein